MRMTRRGLRTFAWGLLALTAAWRPAARTAAGEENAARMPAVFSDHMILQRDRAVPVWGFDRPGQKVVVSFGDSEAEAVADAAGRWRVDIDSGPASAEGRELLARGSAEHRFVDVLVGEVWLASGQSNMEWPLALSENGETVAAAASHPTLRLFKVPHATAEAPVEGGAGVWKVCEPAASRGFSAVAYYFGRELREALDVPVGLIDASWGGTYIEPWTPAEGFGLVDGLAAPDADAAAARAPQHRPYALHNGMVAPLCPYGLRGAIWYQGENNLFDEEYAAKQQALLRGWRRGFANGELAFYFVQIAPHAYGAAPDDAVPLFWERQRDFLRREPGTDMALTLDLVDNVADIHPRRKREVGERLARLALRGVYGRNDVVAHGPAFRDMTTDEASLLVRFDHADGGLSTRDGGAPTHFEIQSLDSGDWRPATAAIEGADTLRLSAPDVARPQAARHAWSKTARPNLCNGHGLPAAAFRSGEITQPPEDQ